MRFALIFRVILLTTVALTGACTKTVIHEIPVAQNANGGLTNPQSELVQPAQSDNPASGSATAIGENQSLADNILEDQSSITLANANYADLYPALSIGEAGETVDCENLLPCRWISQDSAFSITVGSADNIGNLGHLTLNFVISTLHDTQLLISSGSEAVGLGGISYILTQQQLANGNGSVPINVLAGADSNGHFIYDKAASQSILSRWVITVTDNGVPRIAVFENIPIGPAQVIETNCRGTLPCSWTSAAEDVVVSLLSVGGYSGNGRLNVNFTLQATRDMAVVMDSGATALSSEGVTFEGRTHSLDNEIGFAAITQFASDGATLPGNVSFFRTSRPASGLNSLELVLYEDAPVPRWNPVFRNLPTQ